jgi:hypothetical protein
MNDTHSGLFQLSGVAVRNRNSNWMPDVITAPPNEANSSFRTGALSFAFFIMIMVADPQGPSIWPSELGIAQSAANSNVMAATTEPLLDGCQDWLIIGICFHYQKPLSATRQHPGFYYQGLTAAESVLTTFLYLYLYLKLLTADS